MKRKDFVKKITIDYFVGSKFSKLNQIVAEGSLYIVVCTNRST
jgi:hypothetical protein